MGWIPREDEKTGVTFALPPPMAGPEEERRPGRSTAVARRAYTARAGDLAFAVQLFSTPESPGSLARELPPQRMPFVTLDQLQDGGDYEADVVSNERVQGLDHPAYDALLELSGDGEEASWWMRTHALDEVVLVTQVAVFVDSEDSEDSAELEARGAAAFDRLNSSVDIPPDLARTDSTRHPRGPA